MATTPNRNVVSGWAIGFAIFASSLMVLVGVFGIFQGLIALFNQQVLVATRDAVYGIDVATWGWIHLLIGAVLTAAGISVYSGKTWARSVGIVLAILSAIANFLYIPYYPIWSIVIIAVDIAVIWGLASYTQEIADDLR